MELNKVCFATLQFDEPWTLDNYMKVGGYEALKKIINDKISPDDVIEEVKSSLIYSLDLFSQSILCCLFFGISVAMA